MMASSPHGRFARSLLLGLLVALTTATWADEPPLVASIEAVEGGATLDSAAVEIDGRELFPVRGVQTFPAKARAREIAKRIEAAAENPQIRPEHVVVVESDLGTAIRAGEVTLMVVMEIDAALQGLPRDATAHLYIRRVTQAIESYRAERQPDYLLRHGLWVLAATVVFLVVVVFLVWIRRRVVAAFERRYKDRLGGVKIQSVQLVQQERVWLLLRGILRAIWIGALLVAAYVYATTSLELLPWTRGVGRDLLKLVLDPLATLGQGLVAFIPNLIFLVVLFVVTRLVVKVLRLVASGVEHGTVTLEGFDPDWAWPTFRIVRGLIVIFALVVAYPYIPGSGSMAFKGLSLFIGVVFSLGSSSVISNLLAGYSMTYRRAFRVGDRIRVGDTTGEVVETRLLVTHLRTIKNEEVIVPNSLILNGTVVNYSSVARKQGLILHTTVGIGYETPWRQVEAMLLLAAGRTTGLEAEPRPFVLLTQLGDFCVTYEINVYSRDPSAIVATYAALHRSILDVFNEHGVQIMTPAYEGDPAEPKIVAKEAWYTAPAAPPQENRG